MKTDSILYEIFQKTPVVFFGLVEQSSYQTYRFDSVEVKQTASRIDGVFLPQENQSETPVYFVGVKFQKDDDFPAVCFQS